MALAESCDSGSTGTLDDGNGVFGLCAPVFFLLGKYAACVARHENHRMLRPSASFLLLGALIFSLTVITSVATWAGFPNIDGRVARIWVVVLALVGVKQA